MSNYEIRSMIGVIVATGCKPFNYGKPYSGVLIGGYGDGGYTCSYLSRTNTSLEHFIKE